MHAGDDPVLQVERSRPRLFGIAYRMLGDAHEAEDLVQETFLRWYQTDRAAVDTPEAWLVAVVTRLSIDRLRRAEVERVAYVGPWLPEPIATLDPLTAPPPLADQAAELASDLSVALLALLERLAPEERAAFLLRDVFDVGYGEIARVFEGTEAAARQMVHRARGRVRAGRPRFTAPPDARERLLRRFLDALAADDQDALIALFDPAVTFTSDGGGKAPAARNVLEGSARVGAFLLGVERKAAGRLAHRLAWLNGESAIVSDLRLPGAPAAVFCATAFATDGTHIHAVYRVLNPAKLRRIPTR